MSYMNQLNSRQNTRAWPNAFTALEQQLESIFGDFTTGFDASRESEFFGASNGKVKARWYEKDDAYLLRIDLPGLKAKDIELEWLDGVLSVSADRVFDGAVEEAATKATQSIKQSFKIPEEVDQDNVTARYEEGVLVLTLPKSEKAKPRRIKVTGDR